MSLLRLLPALRTLPAPRRTCVVALSYSAPRRAEPQEKFFDTVLVDNVPAPVDESIQGMAEDDVEDDGPPRAPPDSFPRNPPMKKNPITLARESGKQSSVGGLRQVYAVSVKASRNNTIMTFARPNGSQLVTVTGGKLGFKKSNRNGYEAGYQCAVAIVAAMEEELRRVDFEWELYLNGFGQGREAIITALTTAVGSNVKMKLRRVTDRTPLKIGGTRGQKTRRV